MLFMGILLLRCIARLKASPRYVAPTFWVALSCCLLFVGLSVQVSVQKPCNVLFKVVKHFFKEKLSLCWLALNVTQRGS